MSRAPIDMMLDGVVWRALPPPSDTDPNPDGLPYATHEGVLHIGEIALRCHQLSNGKRVLDAEDVERFFGALATGEEPTCYASLCNCAASHPHPCERCIGVPVTPTKGGTP